MAPAASTPATITAVDVAEVPLRAPKGPGQLLMSAGFSLGLWDLQHFMVVLRPDPAARAQALVFDFQPRDPEDVAAALAVLSRGEIPGESSPAISIDSFMQGRRGSQSKNGDIYSDLPAMMDVQAWFGGERCGGSPAGGAGSSGTAARGTPSAPPTGSASGGRPAWSSGSTTAGTTPTVIIRHRRLRILKVRSASPVY